MADFLITIGIIAMVLIGLGVPIALVVITTRNLERSRQSQTRIVLKTVAALVVWAALSVGELVWVVLNAFLVEYPPGVERTFGAVAICLSDLVFAAAGFGLVYWAKGRTNPLNPL